MLNVSIVGGYDAVEDPETAVRMQTFVKELTRQLLRKGHSILGAAATALDADVASAVVEEMASTGQNPRAHLISWVCRHDSSGQPAKPSHGYGRQHVAERPNWDPASSIQGVPEPIERADVVVFVGGYQGTRRAYFWSDHMRKPIIPVAYFGGAAAEIFKTEIRRFEERYARRMRRLDYEELSEIGLSAEEQAATVARLVEDIAFPRKVTVAMSYGTQGELAQHLETVFQLFKDCCKIYDYDCDRVSHLNVLGRIVGEIKTEITQAAFVIVDITELKRNVMYELGYAEGLGKPLIVTAQDGTDRPFDINDIPILYWTADRMDKLKAELLIKIDQIAAQQGRRRAVE